MNLNQYLTGYVEMAIHSPIPEKLINTALYRGLKLWDIKRIDDQTIHLKVPLHHLWSFIQLVRQQKSKFKVISRIGFPFAISKLKHRKGLALGSCLFFVIVYLSLSFVWTYDVVGNERYSDEQIIAMVQQLGIIPGVSVRNIDYDAIQTEIVDHHDDISFVKITSKGTQIVIKIQESNPKNLDDPRPAHLIAKRSGVIKQLLVFKGTAQVALEQEVAAGDLLIAGVEYHERTKNQEGIYDVAGEPTPIRAKGIVYGNVNYTAVGLCHLNETTMQRTGQEETQVALSTPYGKWVILGPKDPVFNNSQQTIDTKTLWHWKDYVLPMYLVTTEFKEQAPVAREYTLAQAYEQSIQRAREKLKAKIDPESEFIEEAVRLVPQSNSQLVQVEVIWTVQENMASPQLITNNSSR